MVEPSLDTWRGTVLLEHLIGKLDSTDPYADVVAHTL